jgi:acetylornithine deacetylase/succinyl-diaminopimelate desuccinylase-like protein
MNVQQWAECHRKDLLEGLCEFVRIPSISTDPASAKDVRKAADWLIGWAAREGFAASLLETPGHPAVLIETPPVAGKPVLLIYGHYDVQPAEDLELWTSPPFSPRIEGDQIYGRGVSDNKGQIWAHLCSLRAQKALDGSLPLQVKILIEGEEESGSVNLPVLLEQQRDRLAADLVLVSDTSMVIKGYPTIHYSLRGVTIFEVFLETAARDVHSGVFGGTSPNAIHVLCDLIAKLHDKDHRVTVPGFYDKVRPLEDWEAGHLHRIPFEEEVVRKFIGCSHMIGEAGFSTNERRWFRPTLECNGITGGYQGEGSKTIVPARASAKFSIRTVADQDGMYLWEICEAWFQSHCPEYARLDFERQDQGPPYLLRQDEKTRRYLEIASRALESSFGREPLLCRHGGAIPIVEQFRSILGLDTLLLGLGSPDDAIHSPNEKYELPNFFAGIAMSAAFMQGLAT